MDLMKPQFTQAEVLEATGMDAATLQTWTTRRFVIPASEHPGRAYGKGGRRLYSAEDGIWLALLKAVVDWGMPISMALTFCDFGTVRNGLRQNNGELPFLGLVRVHLWSHEQREQGAPVNASFVQKVENRDQLLTNMAGATEPVFYLPTRAIETRTRAKLEEIAARRQAEVEA